MTTASLADTLVFAVELEAERLRRERASRAALRRAYRLAAIAHALASDRVVRDRLDAIGSDARTEVVAEVLDQLDRADRSHADEPVQKWLAGWADGLNGRPRTSAPRS